MIVAVGAWFASSACALWAYAKAKVYPGIVGLLAPLLYLFNEILSLAIPHGDPLIDGMYLGLLFAFILLFLIFLPDKHKANSDIEAQPIKDDIE